MESDNKDGKKLYYEVKPYGQFEVTVDSEQISVHRKITGESFRLASAQLAKEVEFYTNNTDDIIGRAICRQLPGAKMLFSNEEPSYDEDPYGNLVRRGNVTVERWDLSGVFKQLNKREIKAAAADEQLYPEIAERLKQFAEMKTKHPDAVLLFRVGDFYESYGKDATKCSTVLGLTLTHRAIGNGKKVDLTGFPHHALDLYLPKLVRAGCRVAICEQLQDPKLTKKRVARSTPTKPETKHKTEMEPQPSEPKQAPQQQPQPQQEAQPREPQMVTVNGDKVTHAHVFQSEKDENVWYFTARLNGEPLRAQRMKPEDAEAYKTHKIGVEQLMEKYYLSKVAPKVSEEAWSMPTKTIDGNISLEITKLNVYKEKNPESPNVGKWMFYAEVNGQKMSAVADRALLSAYFDRTATPGQIVKETFGEKLHLASAYEKYKWPEGRVPGDITIRKNPETGKWQIVLDRSKGSGYIESPENTKELSFDDGYAFFRAKTATREQLAAKYFSSEYNQSAGITADKPQEERKSSLKR